MILAVYELHHPLGRATIGHRAKHRATVRQLRELTLLRLGAAAAEDSRHELAHHRRQLLVVAQVQQVQSGGADAAAVHHALRVAG